jgi:uncharacterized membrane protein (DUF485 family)
VAITPDEHIQGSHTHAQAHDPLYERLAQTEDFKELRRSYRAFVFPWTVAFLSWYFLYVILSSWAPDFMGIKVVGNINLGLVLGLLQFVTTFLIAWHYSRVAAKRFDPLAARVREEFDKEERP